MRKLFLTYALIVGALVYGWQASAQLTATGFGGGFGKATSAATTLITETGSTILTESGATMVAE